MKRHKTVAPLAARILRQVQKEILNEPGQLYMDEWYSSLCRSNIPNCGTAACIGGWGIVVVRRCNPKRASRLFEYGRYAGRNEGAVAGELMHLTGEQRDALFFVDNWPCKYQRQYDLAPEHHLRRRARIAVNRIDHFIKTGD